MTINIQFDAENVNWLNGVRERDEKSDILNELETLVKNRVYVDSAEDVPDDKEVQEGDQGGLYYETGSTESGETEDSNTTDEQREFADKNPKMYALVQQLNARFGPKITQSFIRNAGNVLDYIDPNMVAQANELFLSENGSTNIPIGMEKATEGLYMAKDVEIVATEKGRRYVESPEEVPEGFEAQEGPQGGLYYETDGGDSEGDNGASFGDDWIAPPEDNSDLIEGQSVLMEAGGDFYQGEVTATTDVGLTYVDVEEYGRMKVRPNQDIKEIVAVEEGNAEVPDESEDKPSGGLSVEEAVEEMKDASVIPENQIERGAELLQEGEITPETMALASAKMGIDRKGHAKRLAQDSTFDNSLGIEMGYQLGNFRERKAQLQDYFEEEHGSDAKTDMLQMSDSWIGPMFVPATAGLFQYAAEQTGHASAPAKRDTGPFDTEARERRIESAKKAHEHTTEVLRDTFGDTVTVFRGIAPEGGLGLGSQQEDEDSKIAQMREAVENGSDVEKENRTLESWTTSVEYASRYAGDDGGMIFRREVPVEKVLMSSHSGFLSAGENEMVIMDDETTTYDNDDVIIPDHMAGQDFMELQAEAIYNSSESSEEEETEDMDKDVFRLPVENDNPHWLHQLDTDDPEEAEKSEEVLEIRDSYRIWVKGPESVPEEQNVFYDKQGDPAGNHYYYEIPFETKTRIDVSEDVDKALTKAMQSKSGKEYPERIDLVDIGVPEKDLTLVDKARTQIENDMALFGNDIRKSNPSILNDVESGLTLLHLYKMLYEEGAQYEAFMNQIQKELGRRGIYSFEKVSKARRYINSPEK